MENGVVIETDEGVPGGNLSPLLSNVMLNELDKELTKRGLKFVRYADDCYWKQWKKTRTKYRNLMKLGATKQKAWEHANTRKSYWRTAKSPILNTTITNSRLENN